MSDPKTTPSHSRARLHAIAFSAFTVATIAIPFQLDTSSGGAFASTRSAKIVRLSRTKTIKFARSHFRDMLGARAPKFALLKAEQKPIRGFRLNFALQTGVQEFAGISLYGTPKNLGGSNTMDGTAAYVGMSVYRNSRKSPRIHATKLKLSLQRLCIQLGGSYTDYNPNRVSKSDHWSLGEVFAGKVMCARGGQLMPMVSVSFKPDKRHTALVILLQGTK